MRARKNGLLVSNVMFVDDLFAIGDQFGSLSRKQVSQEKTNIVFPKNMK